MLIENLFYCPVKSISFTESKSLQVLKNKGIENDRVFSFVQNQDKNKIEILIKDPQSRKLNNFVTLKNTPELNKFNFTFIENKLILRKRTKEIFSINPYSKDVQNLISEKISNYITKEKKINFIVDKIHPFLIQCQITQSL